MYGGHQALAYGKGPVQYLDQWRQTIRGTGRIGDNLLACRQLLMIDPVDHHGIGIVHRITGQHSWCASVQVVLELGAMLEFARSFNHQIRFQAGPRQGGEFRTRETGDAVAVNFQMTAVIVNRVSPAPVGAIEGQQVRQHGKVGQVIDGHQLKAVAGRVILQGADNAAANASKAIDSNTKCPVCIHRSGSVYHPFPV